MDGPFARGLVSGALFYLTEGRATAARPEYRAWLSEVGLVPGKIVPTRVHCGVLPRPK